MSSILDWFRKPAIDKPVVTPVPKSPAPTLIKRPSFGPFNGYTLTQWQASNEKVKYAQRLFQEPEFKDLLAVLMNARPRVSQDDMSNPNASAVALGRFLGYDQCLSILLMLPQFPEIPAAEVEADYGAHDGDLESMLNT